MEKSPASNTNLFSEISDEVVKIFYVYLNSFRKSEACFARGSEHLRNPQKIVQTYYRYILSFTTDVICSSPF